MQQYHSKTCVSMKIRVSKRKGGGDEDKKKGKEGKSAKEIANKMTAKEFQADRIQKINAAATKHNRVSGGMGTGGDTEPITKPKRLKSASKKQIRISRRMNRARGRKAPKPKY